MKKNLKSLFLSCCMIGAMSITAFAGEWKQDDLGWTWRDHDGCLATNSWRWIDGNQDGIAECYFFDQNGYLVTNTTTSDGYTVNEDGAWVADGQVQIINVNEKQEYTNKINNKVWALMNNSLTENQAQYGVSTYPYHLVYYNFDMVMTEEESNQSRPYILQVFSEEAPLTAVFEDAPEVHSDTTIEEIGNYLEGLGYQVEWGKTNLGLTDTCWITIDRFEMAFSKENDGFVIKLRQDKEKNMGYIFEAMMMPTATSAQ